MPSDKKIARTAGFIYLIVVLTGTFSLGYVPSRLIIRNNAAETVNNIKASEVLFRLSILSSIICYVFFLLLPLVLYKLLRQFNENYARLMVILALVSVPISFINLQNKLEVLTLISDAPYLNIFSEAHLHSQVMLYLDSYNKGILIAQVFWGLWLFPFGWLVYISNFLPRILGIFLLAGCIGYLINVAGRIVFPHYGETIISSYATLPASIGEIGTCLWLLIAGVRNKTTVRQS